MPDIRGLAATIKDRVSAWDMGVQMGLNPDRSGFCPCPFHGETKGSMRLYKGTGGWYCFGCHAGGSVLDLVMRYYGLNLWSAILHIDAAFGLGLPLVPDKPMTARERQAADLKRRLEQSRRAQDAELDKAALEAFWLAGDLFNEMDAQTRSRALRGLSEAENEDFWELLRLRESAREQMEDLAIMVYGCDSA